MTLNEQLRMQTRISKTNKQKGKVKPYPSMFLNTKNKRTTIPAKIELPATEQMTDSTISASKKVHLQGGIRQYNNTSLDTLAIRSMTREYVLNPCFSGTYSQSTLIRVIAVSQLSLNPCFSGTYSQRT